MDNVVAIVHMPMSSISTGLRILIYLVVNTSTPGINPAIKTTVVILSKTAIIGI